MIWFVNKVYVHLFEFLSKDRVPYFKDNAIILMYYFVLKGGKPVFCFSTPPFTP